jgi:hypothetical protein
MTIETLSRAQLALEFGYSDSEGTLSDRAVAQFMRDALLRWGMCPRRALLKHAREQLRAAGIETDSAPRVLERIVALGECDEVEVGHERFVLPAEPRWIDSGGRLAVLLGPVVPPADAPRLATNSTGDVVVRVHMESEDCAVALEARGVRQVSLLDWLHPMAFMRHAARRASDAVRADQFGLVEFWGMLVDTINADGLAIDEDAEIRAVCGQPGGFFGRQTAAVLEGRWRNSAPDGVWCAYRRGHGEGNWLPTLIAVDGADRRVLDLFDHDEWRWALLARSRVVGPDEIVERTGDEVHVTWPLPAQIRAAMDIVGIPAGMWRWQVAHDAPDVWAMLR